jgi:hypothetical protein
VHLDMVLGYLFMQWLVALHMPNTWLIHFIWCFWCIE